LCDWVGPSEQAAAGQEGPEVAAVPVVPDGVRSEGRARSRAAYCLRGARGLEGGSCLEVRPMAAQAVPLKFRARAIGTRTYTNTLTEFPLVA
jgi:hypothetical protein